MKHLIRSAARPLVLGLALVLMLFAAPDARAGKAAEAYVQKLADDAMAIINNSSLSKAQKNTQLGTLLDANIEVEKIGLFTLGPHRRTAAQGDLDAYLAAFHEYLIAYYVKNLGNLSRATFKVTGSSDLSRNRGTVVASTASGDGGDPIEINWRVVNDSSVQDIQVAGVWMALSLREQMVSVIDNNQGKVAAATAKLREIVAGLS
ncbi:MAG: ABC transporter substrate-binding protein [Alphaproteobacteria bacterium]